MRLETNGARVELRHLAGWLGAVVSVAILCVAAPALVAAEEPGSHGQADEHGEEHAGEQDAEHAGEHGGEHLHKHHMVVFLGSTEAEVHHGEQADPDFTIGFDYERRLSKHVGFGGMVDFVVEGKREGLIGPLAIFHPTKNAKFFFAPCYQRVREGNLNEFVLRVGVAWDFHIGKYSISPTGIYDFAGEQDFIVLGVAFGKGF